MSKLICFTYRLIYKRKVKNKQLFIITGINNIEQEKKYNKIKTYTLIIKNLSQNLLHKRKKKKT